MDMSELLRALPSVDEVLKGPYGEKWLERYPRGYVLKAVRDTIDKTREAIKSGHPEVSQSDITIEALAPEIDNLVIKLSSLSLRPLINATGIVIHTNLGRAVLSKSAIENVAFTSGGYSNLEYDLDEGKRGKRHAHIKRLLREVTGAEDGIAVNNNAAAVFLTLNTLAKGKEVIVSRGELVEIGGSFRVPDVMEASSAVLREVGTTNKTHLYDYEKASTENTALILKVHQSNYRITGFTEDVPIEELAALGRRKNIPVMFDLGSGCMVDLKPYGIATEPAVSETIKKGADIVTFSGDKLLGGPQAGLIAGRKDLIELIQRNPLARAVRIDKMTLSALEATLMEYVDEDKAKRNIPTLRMLREGPSSIKKRAKAIAYRLRKAVKNADIEVMEDSSQAGGGALPETLLPTYVVSISAEGLSPNKLEERLRKGNPAVIARIREDLLLLDARTIREEEAAAVAKCVIKALSNL